MRLWILIVLFMITAGCGTIDSRSRREISLLRAEILDLEDQYYSLKSRHKSTVAELAACRGEPIPNDFGEDIYYDEGVISDGYYPGHTIIDGYCEDCDGVHSPGMIFGGNHYPSDVGTGIVDPLAQPFDETLIQPVEAPPGEQPFIQPQTRNRPTNSSSPISESPIGAGALPGIEPAFRPDINSERTLWRQTDTQAKSDLSVRFRNQSGENGSQPSWSELARSNDYRDEFAEDRFLDQEMNNEPISNAHVEQVYLNPELTFASDFNGDGEDDGITLLIQPLDASGNVVPRASDMIVSLLDPKAVGEDQRIGLWKFQSYQVESFVSDERGRKGLVLELPWQRRLPKNRELIVFVRYSSQGRKLETSLDLIVEPPTGDVDLNGPDPVIKSNSSADTSAGVPKWRPVR